MDYGSGGTYRDVSFGRRGSAQTMTLQVGDIGMERDSHGDEDMITDVLDLVRSVTRDNPQQAAKLMVSLEDGEPVVAHTMTESQPPDLVQLTTMILEEALSRSNGGAKSPSRIKPITSAISVLSALLAIPNYSGRVWLYIRSTTTLFGSDKVHGFASGALTTERATGRLLSCYFTWCSNSFVRRQLPSSQIMFDFSKSRRKFCSVLLDLCTSRYG